MIRNFKALGLALMAIFALSAVAASGASASKSIFDSEVDNTILTGTSEDAQIFTRGILSISCSHAAFSGTAVGKTTSTIEIQADYTTTSCIGPLNSQVHVDFKTDKCGYHFTGTAATTAVAKLVCNPDQKEDPGTGEVILTATNSDGSSLCTIHIPHQTVGGHVTFKNIISSQHNNIDSVTATATATNITSTRTGSSLCGPVNHATATYTGSSTLTGYADNAGAEGSQVAIEVTD